jgi:hypothetical protein
MNIYILVFLTLSFIGPSENMDIKIDKVWKTPYFFNELQDCNSLAFEFKKKGLTTDCVKVYKEDINGR